MASGVARRGRRELLAAVHDAVADGVDLARGGVTPFSACVSMHDLRERFAMLEDLAGLGHLRATGRLERVHRAAGADAVTAPFADHHVGIRLPICSSDVSTSWYSTEEGRS